MPHDPDTDHRDRDRILEDVPNNLARLGGEVGPVCRLGLVKQFGIMLPHTGLPHTGLPQPD